MPFLLKGHNLPGDGNLLVGHNLSSTSVTVTISGLTGGYAVSGDHASITMTGSETITARKWGSTSGGSEYGTGTNPTDYDGGTTLYATATMGGSDYTASATIAEISFGTPTYDRGTAGVAPDLTIPSVSTTGVTGGTYNLYVGVYTAATTDDADDIENGTGDANEYFTIGPEANIVDLDSSGLDLSTALGGGANDALRFVYVHSSGVQSAIGAVTAVNYDATAPAFSSAEVGNVDADTVEITLSKATYDPGGGIDAADFALTGNTITAASLYSTTAIRLTLGTTATDSDDYSGDLDYTGDYLVGVDGEVMATFADQDVTNNVSSGPTLALLDADATISNQTTYTWNTQTLHGSTGEKHLVAIFYRSPSSLTLSSGSVDGNTLTAISGASVHVSGAGIILCEANTTANATGTVTFTLSNNPLSAGYVMMSAEGVTSFGTAATDASSTTGAPNIDVNTSAGDAVAGFAMMVNGSADWTWNSDLSDADMNREFGTNEWGCSGFANNVAAETPRQIRPTNGTSNNCVGISLPIS